MLLLAFIVAYVFGREYADGTAKNLLALPVGRHWFVLAKLVVVGSVVGRARGGGPRRGVRSSGSRWGCPASRRRWRRRPCATRCSRPPSPTCSSPVVAWIATLGRGYMAPLGFALAMLALGNVFSKTGWATWFPWSIVAALIGTVGATRRTTLAPGSFVVVALTFLAGIAATIAQLRYADNAQ